MKTTLSILAVGIFLSDHAHAGQTNALSVSTDPLVATHDLNGNGKIDVNERQAYVRDLSRRGARKRKPSPPSGPC